MASHSRIGGLDFGTSNSALAIAGANGHAQLHTFRTEHAGHETFPSVLHVPPGRQPQVTAGPWAVEAYRSSGEGRLLQSIKSFVANATFEGTRIAGRLASVEELIALMLIAIRRDAEQAAGSLGEALWVGRPVRFAGAKADEELALGRLRRAFGRAGWTDVTFVPEPVAAAYHYCRRIETRQNILVADFGAGTSDFSVLEAQPGHDPTRPAIKVLGISGIGIAGDTFDARIVQHAIAPALGSRATYLSDHKRLPMPRWLFADLSRWHHLALMNTAQNLALIRTLSKTSDQPDRLDALHVLIEQGYGFRLYQAVSNAKAQLSSRDEAAIQLDLGHLSIARTIPRDKFDRWIAEDVRKLELTLDKALTAASIAPHTIERVFMTGGTSLVPAVRQLFERRFGAERLAYGDEFLSVAKGLGIMAMERGRDLRA
jgi:hypothetical chaperone protein